MYSGVPNKRAACLLTFEKFSFQHAFIRSNTFIKFSEIFFLTKFILLTTSKLAILCQYLKFFKIKTNINEFILNAKLITYFLTYKFIRFCIFCLTCLFGLGAVHKLHSTIGVVGWSAKVLLLHTLVW